MVLSRINFKSLLVAGLVGGYAMFVVDKFFAGLFGLFGLFPGTENGWWMLTHHVDAVVFALPFVWPTVYEMLPGTGWLKGMAYGFLFWLLFPFITGMIAGALGAEYFQQMEASASVVVTMILLHLVWGFFLGALYVPPEESTA